MKIVTHIYTWPTQKREHSAEQTPNNTLFLASPKMRIPWYFIWKKMESVYTTFFQVPTGVTNIGKIHICYTYSIELFTFPSSTCNFSCPLLSALSLQAVFKAQFRSIQRGFPVVQRIAEFDVFYRIFLEQMIYFWPTGLVYFKLRFGTF